MSADYPEQEGELRSLIARFAEEMLGKLLKHRRKGGPRAWRTDSAMSLWNRIGDEAAEPHEALCATEGRELTPELRAAVRKEAADVANFALMIADIYREPDESNTEDTTPGGAR